MKIRMLLLGLAALSASLIVACGGGGGGTPPVSTATPSPIPTRTSTPTPVRTQTPNPYGCVGQPLAVIRRPLSQGPRPITPGDTFSYTGTLSETVVQSEPCPQPTATTSAAVTISITDSSASSPSGATDSTSVESDAFPTGISTTTTDSTIEESPSLESLVSTTSTDQSNNKIATVYSSPQPIDQLPEGLGNSWSINPAGTVTETLSDGSNYSRTLSADGSYNETDTIAGGNTDTIEVNSDESGKYSLESGGMVLQFAAPAIVPGQGSGSVITITQQAGSATPAPPLYVPQWFPGGTKPFSDISNDQGSATIPDSCRPSFLPSTTTGESILETTDTLDPVLGYTERRQTQYFDVSGYGSVCIEVSDTQNRYYDYQLDTTAFPLVSNTPYQTDTISETLTLTTPTTGYSVGRRPELASIAHQSVVLAERAIDRIRSVQRAQRMRVLTQYLQRRARKGGVL